MNLSHSIEILESTPRLLNEWLKNLSDPWLSNNEGENTWSPFDIVGHLLHGEKTDWIPRLRILHENNNGTFIPFDRFAQFEDSKGKDIHQLLDEFTKLRKENISILKELNLQDSDFYKKANHPELGPVKLSQLLAAWVVHDLGHIVQIARVMAKQYKDYVGPWEAYLTVLNK